MGQVKARLSSRNEDLFYMSVFITLSAAGYEELLWRKQQMTDLMKSMDIQVSGGDEVGGLDMGYWINPHHPLPGGHGIHHYPVEPPVYPGGRQPGSAVPPVLPDFSV